MQVLIALVMLSFLGWYGKPSGDKSHTVLTVNGTQISDAQFNSEVREQIAYAEKRYGRALSQGEEDQLREMAKNAMIEKELVLEEAHRLGLEVSSAEVARVLLHIGFRDKDGKFSDELYSAYLKRQRLTKTQFEKKLLDELTEQKLHDLVYMGANVSEPAILDAWKEANTRLDLKYVRIRSSVFDDDVQVTPDQVGAWLKENEAEAKETYDKDKERLYDHPETARLRMIRFEIKDDGVPVADLVARMGALRDEIAAGGDMDALARKWSEDATAGLGGDMGVRPVPQLQPEVTDAITDLKAGELSKVVTAEKDVRLYRVEERTAAHVEEFETVKNAIAEKLIRAEKTPTMAADYADALLQRWKAEGAPPQDLLDQQKLVAADTGPIAAQPSGSPFAPPDKMLAEAAHAKIGEVLPDVYENNGVLWVGRLNDRQEAPMADYEAQKDKIRDQYLEQRRSAFYQDWVSSLKANATIQ
jgi:peptidyl-prolyl cis-trans isomerase D